MRKRPGSRPFPRNLTCCAVEMGSVGSPAWWFQRQRPTNLGQLIEGTASFLAICGFAFSIKAYLDEEERAFQNNLTKEATRCLTRCELLARQRKIGQLVLNLEQYKAQLQREEQSIFYRLGSQSWTDRWIWERNNGRFARAKKAEHERASIKSVFWAAMRCYEDNVERRAEMNEFFFDDPLNKHLAKRFIRLVEPMDEARCRTHEGCVWPKDKPRIYSFLREMYGLDEQLADRNIIPTTCISNESTTSPDRISFKLPWRRVDRSDSRHITKETVLLSAQEAEPTEELQQQQLQQQ